MKVFDIYRYANVNKGLGYGEHIDYFVLDDPEIEEAYDNSGPLERPTEEDIASRAGYSSHCYSAERISVDFLKEKKIEHEKKAKEIEEVLAEVK